MVTTCEVNTPDGRTLLVYDTGDADRATDTALIWHHGTPQTGQPPAPLVPAFDDRGVRCVSYDRPGYGGSAPWQGRDVASAAADVAVIADALGIDKFATIGVSSGGPHALACAALLPGRVTGVVTVAGPAPFTADGLDWFAGMGDAATARMRAGTRGRAAAETHLGSIGFAADTPTMSDLAALVKEWDWLSDIGRQAMVYGLCGAIDDVMSMVTPWGFRPSEVNAPVLIVHGADDLVVPVAHGRWLAQHLSAAKLWLRPGDGHVGVLTACTAALDWLIRTAGGTG
jgi:pimeloyl-ACP methyl ester carboxylesterase